MKHGRKMHQNFLFWLKTWSQEGTDATDKSLFQLDIVSLRLSTMLIPNTTMIFPHRLQESEFLENQFSTIKKFFSSK
jgi:hypothetical protein